MGLLLYALLLSSPGSTTTTKSFTITGFPAMIIIVAIAVLIVLGVVFAIRRLRNR